MCLRHVIRQGEHDCLKSWAHGQGWKIFMVLDSGKLLSPYYGTQTCPKNVWISLPKGYYDLKLRAADGTFYQHGYHFYRYKSHAQLYLYMISDMNQMRDFVLKPIYFRTLVAVGREHVPNVVRQSYYARYSTPPCPDRVMVGVAQSIYVCERHSKTLHDVIYSTKHGVVQEVQ